jgi:hypothetical protein
MDLPNLRTSPNLKQHGSTNQEAKDLANLRGSRWSVRMDRADRLRGLDGPSMGLRWTVQN